MIFVQTFRKVLGDFTERKTPIFQNDVEYVSTFQKSLFELCFASFFGCNSKICFDNLLRPLYLEQYVFFVQMQRHVSAAPVLEG